MNGGDSPITPLFGPYLQERRVIDLVAMDEVVPHALKALILQRRVFGRLPQLDLGQTLGLGEGSRREDDREAIGRELVPRRHIGFRDREVARARGGAQIGGNLGAANLRREYEETGGEEWRACRHDGLREKRALELAPIFGMRESNRLGGSEMERYCCPCAQAPTRPFRARINGTRDAQFYFAGAFRGSSAGFTYVSWNGPSPSTWIIVTPRATAK